MRALLLASSMLLASPLLAQQTAQAEGASNTASIGDEIIVTAQKTEQRLVDVPVTVTAYTGSTLREIGVTQFDQLAGFVPGLNIQEQSPNNPGFVIRGITSDTGSSQGAPAVTVYLNGVDVSRSRGSYFDLYDLERVEVVKGPQSTLFGTAAAVGVVSVITNKAQPGMSGELRAAYGNFNQRRLDGFINMGNDTIAVRVAGAVKLRNGVVPNIAGTPDSQTPNGPRVRDLNGQDQYGARVSVRYTPSDRFTLDLVGTYDGQRAPGTAFKSGTFAPTGGDTSPFTFAEISGSPFSERDLGGELGLVRNVYDLNLTANYKTDGAFSYTLVTGYRNFDSNEVFDADGTQAWYLEFAEDARGEQISAEGRINYDSDTFRAFGGINYFWEKGFQSVPFSTEEGTLLQCAANVIPGLGCINNATGVVSAAQVTSISTQGALQAAPYAAEIFRNEAELDSLSFFLDATWIPTPALEISVGGRYLIEGRDSGFSNNIPNLALTGGPLFFGGPSTNGQVLRSSGSFDAFLPRANLLFRASDSINFYATWSKGRRSPVVNLGARRDASGQIVPNNTLIDEEKTTNYEIGMKGRLGPVNFGIGAYLLKYKNFQISVQEEGNPIAQTRSAGSATNKGVELELTASLSDRVSVFANGAYIDARVDDDPRFVAFAGDRFRLQSKWQGSMGGTVTAPLWEDAELFFTPSMTYRSSVFFELPNNPVTSQGPVTLVNLRAGFQHPDGNWQIMGFAQNLFDNDYVLDAGNTGGGFGIPTFIRGLPGLYGVEAVIRFR